MVTPIEFQGIVKVTLAILLALAIAGGTLWGCYKLLDAGSNEERSKPREVAGQGHYPKEPMNHAIDAIAQLTNAPPPGVASAPEPISPDARELLFRQPAPGSEREVEESRHIVGDVTFLMRVVHRDNRRWWLDLDTGEPIKRNVGEMLALVHSEISEALEAHRKDLMDDKLPQRKGFEVELADAIIRILDMGEGLGLDLGGAMAEKMKYNRARVDHTAEARKQANGKKF